jgi:hypothetical protein
MQRVCLSICLACMGWTVAGAAEEGIPYPEVGKIAPRHARDIAASNWSIGAETMDREYSIYANWKDYLGPLGIKKARIQAGWARTERQPGVYDFDWLDAIVFDMAKQGVEPWMNLSYGNPIYEGGGGTNLRAAAPTSATALAAWQRWVRATVERYRDAIDEWEVWNEPNYHIDAADYAKLLVLTAETVRTVQPKATIIACALGSRVDYKYADKVLALVQAQGKLDLVDQISHHRHQKNPDVVDAEIELEKVVHKYSNHITIRQGEAGCPSAPSTKRAMADYPWTELNQAKHVLRRMLGDLGRDKQSSCFAIVDMKYPDEMNRKGLLFARNDRTVERPKPAYYAVQNLAAIFDDQVVRLRDFACEAPAQPPLSAYGYRHRPSGGTIVTLWFRGEIPSNDNAKKPVDLVFHNATFTEPLYVDLRTGKAYAIPAASYAGEGMTWHFRQVPCYDSPILIADRAALRLSP